MTSHFALLNEDYVQFMLENKLFFKRSCIYRAMLVQSAVMRQ